MTLFGSSEGALGIRDLYRRVSVAIARGVRGEVWVRAEISAIREQSRGCFLTLAEPARDATERDASLDVVVWQAPWARIVAQLEDRGLILREGMTVSLRGEVALRPGTGRLQLRCSALDTDALLGELTARRRALRRALAAEGLLDANRRLPLSAVPLRVGLVASHQSQGYRDFRDSLVGSGYAFVLVERPVLVQGVGAPRAVAEAVAALDPSDVDVVVIVRGGGAPADLDAFDAEVVARAVAAAKVPVWTGLGHTGDRCLADEAASASHATPTACAHALIARVAQFVRAVDQRARRLQELATRMSEDAGAHLAGRRHRLARGAAAQLDRHADGTARRGRDVRAGTARALAGAHGDVVGRAERLPGLAVGLVDGVDGRLRARASSASLGAHGEMVRSKERLETAATRVESATLRAVGESERDMAATRRVLEAYNPTRQLERGWTLTFDGDGNLVRRAAATLPGERITSRFVDGELTSVVEAAAVSR